MSFYVTAVRGDESVLAVGPFRRHGDALACVNVFARWAARHAAGGQFPDVVYGTGRHPTRHDRGKFNAFMPVTLFDGWCARPTCDDIARFETQAA